MGYRKSLLVTGTLAAVIMVVASQCTSKGSADARGVLYAGPSSCRSCHQDIYNSYLTTAHYLTSRKASPHQVHGSFTAPGNCFFFSDTSRVVMEQRGTQLFQAAYIHGQKTREQRFDLVFGGVKAETYLYWKDKRLYQLPMSYFSALQSWTNSPGYDSSTINFDRAVSVRCFECHSAYLKELPDSSQSLQRLPQLDSNTLILSIDCERCHGPGANHVNFHNTYPEVKQAKYMTRYASLSRTQRIDMCAVCHSGNNRTVLRSTFSFKPGDTLDKFKEHDFFPPDTHAPTLDVHGNQAQLLAGSRCFIQSNMDCATCHNTHTVQRNNLSAASATCTGCHSNVQHPAAITAALGNTLRTNCIDCHMPSRPSSQIVVQTAGKGTAVPYTVRTHHIGIYPEETQKIIRYIRQQQRS